MWLAVLEEHYDGKPTETYFRTVCISKSRRTAFARAIPKFLKKLRKDLEDYDCEEGNGEMIHKFQNLIERMLAMDEEDDAFPDALNELKDLVNEVVGAPEWSTKQSATRLIIRWVEEEEDDEEDTIVKAAKKAVDALEELEDEA